MALALLQMVLVGGIMAYLISPFLKGNKTPSSPKTQKGESGHS